MHRFELTRTLFYREWLLVSRRTAEMLNPLLFFVIVVALFPLGISTNPKILHDIAPGVFWIASLLALLLSLPNLFRDEASDGTLEQMILSAYPLSWLLLVKLLVYWLVTAVPIVLIVPLVAPMFSLHASEVLCLMLSLFMGTPVLSLVGAIMSALLVKMPNTGLLLALLVLPLVTPILILGVGLIVAQDPSQKLGLIALMTALMIFSLLFAPMAVSGALRIQQIRS